jgi:hypothetical protein
MRNNRPVPRLEDKITEILLDHAADWSGQTIVTWTLDQERYVREVDARSLAIGVFAEMPDIPASVLMRAVAIASASWTRWRSAAR